MADQCEKCGNDRKALKALWIITDKIPGWKDNVPEEDKQLHAIWMNSFELDTFIAKIKEIDNQTKL